MVNQKKVVGVAQLVEHRSVPCAVRYSNTLNQHRLAPNRQFLKKLSFAFSGKFPPRAWPQLIWHSDVLRSQVSQYSHEQFFAFLRTKILARRVSEARRQESPIYFLFLRLFHGLFAKDFAAYESGKDRRVEEMQQEAIEAIDRLKPYQVGNDLLWRIHELDNIAKHRTLFSVAHDYLIGVYPQIGLAEG